MSDLARDDRLSDIRAFCERLYTATDEREIDTLIGEAAALLEYQAKALVEIEHAESVQIARRVARTALAKVKAAA